METQGDNKTGAKGTENENLAGGQSGAGKNETNQNTTQTGAGKAGALADGKDNTGLSADAAAAQSAQGTGLNAGNGSLEQQGKNVRDRNEQLDQQSNSTGADEKHFENMNTAIQESAGVLSLGQRRAQTNNNPSLNGTAQHLKNGLGSFIDEVESLVVVEDNEVGRWKAMLQTKLEEAGDLLHKIFHRP